MRYFLRDALPLLQRLIRLIRSNTQNMNPTTLAIIAGLTRQLLSVLGGMTAFKGLNDSNTAEAVTGAVVILVSGIWNIYHKIQTEKALKASCSLTVGQPNSALHIPEAPSSTAGQLRDS